MMCKRVFFVLSLAGLSVSGASQAADVGVSISVSQPGVYGRIDIGRFPQPQVVLPQPVIIQPPQPPRVVVGAPPPRAVSQPVYLWVPPGHRKDWRKHCKSYNACGVPVYFVDDSWYDRNVHPQKKGKGKGHDKDGDHPGKGHGKGKND